MNDAVACSPSPASGMTPLCWLPSQIRSSRGASEQDDSCLAVGDMHVASTRANEPPKARTRGTSLALDGSLPACPNVAGWLQRSCGYRWMSGLVVRFPKEWGIRPRVRTGIELSLCRSPRQSPSRCSSSCVLRLVCPREEVQSILEMDQSTRP